MKGLLVALLLTVFMSSPVQAADKDAKWELNMVGVIVESHPLMTAYYKNWLFPEIEKRTDGRVNVTFFNPNTLCPEFEVFPSLLKGVVDMGTQLVERSPIPMPYMSGLNLPGLFRSPMATHIVPQLMMESHSGLAKEFEKFKEINFEPVVPSGFATTKKQVKNLEDVKGMKVLVAAASGADLISALGGTPVVMAPTEFYLALQRGMADGALLPAAVFRTLKINEVCPYFTQAFTTTAFSANLMSRKLWDSFPKDIQDDLNPLFGMASNLRSGMLQQVLDQAILIQLQNEKISIYTLSVEELATWRKSYEPIYETWITDMEKKGYKDARVFLEEVMALSDKYSDPKNYLELYAKYESIIGTPEDAKIAMMKVLTPKQVK